MKRVKKMKEKRVTAVPLQVPVPGRRTMGEEWWREEGLMGPGEGWTWVRTIWPEVMWTGAEMFQQLEQFDSRAAAPRWNMLDSARRAAEGRLRRETGEGGVGVKRSLEVRKRLMVM